MLDRLDRLVLAGSAPRAAAGTAVTSTPSSNRAGLAGASARPAVPTCTERAPVITSTRGPRFVDRAPCPMCPAPSVGIEAHGELRDGTKVRTLTAHSPGLGRVQSGHPRCLAAGMRMVFVDGAWQGVPA